VVSDLPGIARGKAVPATKFAKQSQFFLPNSIYFQTITGGWGEAAGEDGFTEPDMVLKPDMDTATAAPWTGDWTLQVIHDAFEQDGTPVPFSPRNVLKRVCALYRKEGWEPVVAPEMEFFLVARNINPAEAIQPMMGRSGRPAAARQAYSMSAVDEFGPVIDDIYDFAEMQGFEIDGITQEGGAGQLHHLPSAIALMAPYVNSYRRYVKDHAAPINLEWARDNRTTGIRVPVSEPVARRVENRLAGMDCNPYLAIAASLACGYLGLKSGIKPTKEFKGDAYDGDEDIPRDLFSALNLLTENKEMAECLHPDFVRVFSIVKAAEYDEFLQVISPWEREHLLLNV